MRLTLVMYATASLSYDMDTHYSFDFVEGTIEVPAAEGMPFPPLSFPMGYLHILQRSKPTTLQTPPTSITSRQIRWRA